MTLAEKLALLAGLVSAVALIPQLVKAARCPKTAGALSIWSLMLGLLNAVLWLTVDVLLNLSPAVLIPTVVPIVVVALLIAVKWHQARPRIWNFSPNEDFVTDQGNSPYWTYQTPTDVQLRYWDRHVS